MAYIRQYGFFQHLRSTPTAHIVHLKRAQWPMKASALPSTFARCPPPLARCAPP